jgi:serine/threonine-protein kinase SRPK3
LFEFQDVQTWDEDRISTVFGPPTTGELRLHNGCFSDHAPKEVVQGLQFGPGIDESLLGNIRIIDFGQFFGASEPPDGLGIPLPYFPPEVCFGYSPSRASDVWALACIIFEIQTWSPLVPMVFQSFEILVGTQRFTLGTLPPAWKTKYSEEYASDVLEGRGAPQIWFDESVACTWPLESSVDKRASHLSPNKKAELLALLQAALQFEPSQRITAEEILHHPFLQNTASTEDSDTDKPPAN